MAWMPGAVHKPVKACTPGDSREQRGLVLHVQVGNNSPWPWMNDPANRASSDFWVSKTGVIEQYVDTGVDKAWAQASGNAYYASVETEGYPDEALTAQQIGAIAKIMKWGHDTFGWALRVIDNTTDSGLTWHGAGGASWGGHYDCPGTIRKGQRDDIISLASGGVIVAPPTWPGIVLLLVSPIMHNSTVAQWQQRMKDRGWSIVVDGYYGPKSESICRQFQQEKGLMVDGKVGIQTWAATFRNDNITR